MPCRVVSVLYGCTGGDHTGEGVVVIPVATTLDPPPATSRFRLGRRGKATLDVRSGDVSGGSATMMMAAVVKTPTVVCTVIEHLVSVKTTKNSRVG